MPTKEAAELQHSREFVEEQDAAVMRQPPVAKGDFHISRRSPHPDLNLTKSDVKVTTKICSGSPARAARNSHPMPFFTPDSGYSRAENTSPPPPARRTLPLLQLSGWRAAGSNHYPGP